VRETATTFGLEVIAVLPECGAYDDSDESSGSLIEKCCVLFLNCRFGGGDSSFALLRLCRGAVSDDVLLHLLTSIMPSDE